MSVQGLGITSCIRSEDRRNPDVARTMPGSPRPHQASNRFLFSLNRPSTASSDMPQSMASTVSPAAHRFDLQSPKQQPPPEPRKRRPLFPPPPFRTPDPRASLSVFLAPSALPKDCRPESTDITFKAHLSLLRRLTLDPFEAHNRYFFVHKPLARVNAVLATALFNIPAVDNHAAGAMSPDLRAAVMYIACNSQRSVYGMAFAGQMKSLYKSGPAADGLLGDLIINGGGGLSLREIAALDFAQELAASPPAITEATRRRLIDDLDIEDQHLERQVAGVVSYSTFMSRAFGALDVELSYDAVKYASTNLSHGLLWNSAGRHFSPDSIDDFTEPERNSRRESGRIRGGVSKRIPNFISSSVTLPRLLSEANRTQDSWMRAAWIPKAGKLLEMNDCIKASFGFHPFYLSVSAVLGEPMRRALLFGAKELLFLEGEISRRLKFIVCYVSSVCLGRSRQQSSTKNAISFAGRGKPPRPTPRSTTSVDVPVTASREQVLEPHGSDQSQLDVSNSPKVPSVEDVDAASAPVPAPVPVPVPVPVPIATSTSAETQIGYDPIAIITAHAAFLACRYGATAAELSAAVDEKKVQEAMQRYAAQSDDDADMVAYPLGFPLTKKDCAVVLLAHAMAKSPPEITTEHIQYIESAFGRSPFAQRARGGRTCHRATLEVVGATSMWALLERYCAAAVTYDIDFSANLYFSGGAAEPVITHFACSPTGREIGLALSEKRPRTMPWIIERTNTYRVSPSPRQKDRFRVRSRKRSTSFLSTTGDRVNRLFNGMTATARSGKTDKM